MNLTFYPGDQGKENTNIFSNYTNYIKSKKRKKLLFPSIFSHFEIEMPHNEDQTPKIKKDKLYLPYYKNIKQELLTMKRQINSLFDVKNTIFKQMRTRYTSITYKNFVRGFAKVFCGPFGLVTKKSKYLKEYYYMKGSLNDKIYAGKLDFYDYTSTNSNQVTARENEVKKRRLSLSTNLAVVFDKHDVYSVKAITSKRLLNYKKNFVDINRKKYLDNNGLQQINEIPDISNSKKVKKNKLSPKKNLKLHLKTVTNLNKIIKGIKTKKENFSFITEPNKTSEFRSSYKNLSSKIPKRHLNKFRFKNNLNINEFVTRKHS